ncbi:GNAT family N-acetyltransferase [Reyranella massiliensis]|uniref:GNAT family N-acetyltransferase n=1 Tax=Reyranella massiliensis TaxID=445220 RepID=UPI0002D6379C|nr:GNAT family N-acetyltransferase [Reyranella massiliensis]
MSFEIAVGSADDVQRMALWADAEGWNPGKTDAHAFFAADPGGFLIGRLDGEPQACISVVKYGQGFGFLGFYIARPTIRGKGYGIQIWRAGMARLAGRNVGLDGVVAQQGNYKKSGFRPAWNNIRHEGAAPAIPAPAGVTLADARSIAFDRLAAYDRTFFPEARDAFLASWISLPERAAMVALRDGELAGFAVMRRSAAASRVGPLFAATPEIAGGLVSALARKTAAAAVAIDVPDRNKAAVTLAEGMGLKPSFETARMYTGADPEVNYAGLYGVTSLELG